MVLTSKISARSLRCMCVPILLIKQSIIHCPSYLFHFPSHAKTRHPNKRNMLEFLWGSYKLIQPIFLASIQLANKTSSAARVGLLLLYWLCIGPPQ